MTSAEAIPIAIAVVRSGDRVLAGPRPQGVPLAGLWEFPGGKVRPNETPQAAAARECREETGLEVRIKRPYLEVTHQYDHGLLRIQFFDAEPVDPQQPPRPPFRWVRVSDLGSYPFPPTNTAVLEMLVEGDRS